VVESEPASDVVVVLPRIPGNLLRPQGVDVVYPDTTGAEPLAKVLNGTLMALLPISDVDGC
jgi:hypothetical protein